MFELSVVACELRVELLNCERPALLLVISGKRFCSKACRQQDHEQRKSSEDEKLNLLPILTVPDEELGKFADMPLDAPFRYVIQSNAPKEAIAFRLGIMRGGPRHAKFPRMRWFPYRPFRTPAVYSVHEWETAHVPFAGNYVVAYFDANYTPLGKPTFQVEVRLPAPMFSWDCGDLTMTLNPRKLL